MKLSASQALAMDLLADGPMNEACAVIHLGATRERTMRSLERIGFARWYPTPEHWKLTADGRAWLHDEDAIRMLAEVQAKNGAVVEKWRGTP